jgi:hypothetical protein
MLDGVPGYADCPYCGTSLPLDARAPHRCDERHRSDHAVAEGDDLELEFRRFLASPQGRFELFYAARSRGAA